MIRNLFILTNQCHITKFVFIWYFFPNSQSSSSGPIDLGSIGIIGLFTALSHFHGHSEALQSMESFSITSFLSESSLKISSKVSLLPRPPLSSSWLVSAMKPFSKLWGKGKNSETFGLWWQVSTRVDVVVQIFFSSPGVDHHALVYLPPSRGH